MSVDTHNQMHPAYLIDGKPVLGSYVLETAELLQRAHDVGFNVLLGGHEDLDPGTERGCLCKDLGINVIHHVTKFLYHGVELADDISADQTEIPLRYRHSRPDMGSNVIALDEEEIRYERMTDTGLEGCERGANGTAQSVHSGGIILFWPEECAREIVAVRDSPNLYGWYVLDDSPGDARSALRAMYRTIKEHDPDDSHPVCAGFGDAGAVQNFGPGVCDVMVVYWYPVEPNRYMRESTSEEVQWILAEARDRVPGIPFMGIYQAFDGTSSGTGQGVPNAVQLREQIEDFVREGASGLIAFLGSHPSMPGWADFPELEQAIQLAHDEIHQTGGLSVRAETEDMARRRVQPQGYWEKPEFVPGYVPAWRVIAPFAANQHERVNAMFPPDEEIDFDAVYEGTHGPVRWRTWETTGGVMGLCGIYHKDPHQTSYAVSDVSNPTERKAIMRVSTDNDSIVWINGVEVYRFEEEEGVQRDKYGVEVTLPAGEVRILVKCHNRTGGWAFFLRFTELGGSPLDGLTFDPVNR
jgi:hypothetical protein